MLVLLVTFGLADARGRGGGGMRAAGGGLGFDWGVAFPIVISVIALSCICCCWCNRSLGLGSGEDSDCEECSKKNTEETIFNPEKCGSDTVHRSEYIALQKRLEKLEQQVNTRQRIEEEL